MIYIRQQTRQAKSYSQMYNLISNSITEVAHLKIVAETHNYTAQRKPVGEILFKLMIQK